MNYTLRTFYLIFSEKSIVFCAFSYHLTEKSSDVKSELLTYVLLDETHAPDGELSASCDGDIELACGILIVAKLCVRTAPCVLLAAVDLCGLAVYSNIDAAHT